ncbi:unnamed protein product [Adineta steineri]|uniref:F-box domain-containing protein n=1 Tax=Adineta steineri TaxID=433720 RepID=A0A815PG73_9BILA|nr:unnamed protein product [Adineta steineri]CAF1629935.1 unnamed protein product [Adineta steineri]
MKLESLSNELFFELFECLDGVHLIRAFHDLNFRFNKLLFDHFRQFQFDFRSISKRDFDFICQQYLPLIINRVTSLSISDNEETSDLFDHLLTYGFTLHQFTCLKSLSFFHKKLNKILIESIYLIQLTHLKLIQCYYNNHEDELVDLINTIWRLPKLTHCYLDFEYAYGRLFNRLDVISSSIECISSPWMQCSSKDFQNLLEHTPRLRHLDAICYTVTRNDLLKTIVPTITKLHVIFISASETIMINLFQSMPNLTKLTVQLFIYHLNGHQWKEIIVNYLPNIKLFRFSMNFQSSIHNADTEKQLNELLDTFRTSFWLDENHWYVRCHWDSQDIIQNAHIYTLPHTFPYCFDRTRKPRLKLNGWCRSTCPNDQELWSYDYVRESPLTREIEDWALSPMSFPKINTLQIVLPTHESIWSIIPTLNYLTSLTIYIFGNNAQFQLQALLDRAPHLYSLAIRNDSTFQFLQWNIRSVSIRRLDLMQWETENHLYCNAATCFTLINSLWRHQCEILLIDIENRSIIIDLINRMSNLRSLTVRCYDDELSNSHLSSAHDDFIDWLKICLPSKCSIRRHKSDINIWINKEN